MQPSLRRLQRVSEAPSAPFPGALSASQRRLQRLPPGVFCAAPRRLPRLPGTFSAFSTPPRRLPRPPRYLPYLQRLFLAPSRLLPPPGWPSAFPAAALSVSAAPSASPPSTHPYPPAASPCRPWITSAALLAAPGLLTASPPHTRPLGLVLPCTHTRPLGLLLPCPVPPMCVALCLPCDHVLLPGNVT